MSISAILALMLLSPVLALADVQWHKFGVTGDKETIPFGSFKETQGNARKRS